MTYRAVHTMGQAKDDCTTTTTNYTYRTVVARDTIGLGFGSVFPPWYWFSGIVRIVCCGFRRRKPPVKVPIICHHTSQFYLNGCEVISGISFQARRSIEIFEYSVFWISTEHYEYVPVDYQYVPVNQELFSAPHLNCIIAYGTTSTYRYSYSYDTHMNN